MGTRMRAAYWCGAGLLAAAGVAGATATAGQWPEGSNGTVAASAASAASTASTESTKPIAPAAATSSDPAPQAGLSDPRLGDREGARLLAMRSLALPVEGVGADALRDTYGQGRGERRHEAIDIPAPRGTPVRAVDDGRLVKLFDSRPGGLTVYQFDPEERLAYYYAHLDRYAEGLKEGAALRRGDLIGYVGSTGNASAEVPHLHFAVFRLGPAKQWWRGVAVNPYPALRQVR